MSVSGRKSRCGQGCAPFQKLRGRIYFLVFSSFQMPLTFLSSWVPSSPFKEGTWHVFYILPLSYLPLTRPSVLPGKGLLLSEIHNQIRPLWIQNHLSTLISLTLTTSAKSLLPRKIKYSEDQAVGIFGRPFCPIVVYDI